MKQRKSSLTPKLHQNWWIDTLLGFGALVAVLSSLYFLAFPVSGYQGGRNPYYNLVVVFSRHTWDIIHTWSGVVMILAAVLHIAIHWDWITKTASRTWQVMIGKRKPFGSRLTYNIFLDATVAVCFVICAISGIYFLFFTGSQAETPLFIFNKVTWDLIHTWSGVIMTIAAILHFVLHWRWVTNITAKMFIKQKPSIEGNDPDEVLEAI